MSRFLKYKGKKNATIYNFSDWHVGSKSFKEDAALKLVDMVKKDKSAYVTFTGDMLEGKPVKSKHFDPNSLHNHLITIDQQRDYFCELVKPIADRFLSISVGNHELYLLPDFDVTRAICAQLGREDAYGDYQCWITFGDVTLHTWHGRRSMPKGAKDPIQREANRKAWLKREFEDLAGSAHAHYMGHTHQFLIVKPQLQVALLNSGENVHRQRFYTPEMIVDGKPYVPKESRWYVNTGTLRGAGGFEHMDYAEIAGYMPSDICCAKTTIKGGKIENIEKVEL